MRLEKFLEGFNWENAPTKNLTKNIEPLIKKTVFKIFKKNGKPYLIECVICLYEKDFDKRVMADYRFGYAKVHPDDTFDEKLGKRLAYERALNCDNKVEGLTKKLYREVNEYNFTFKWDMEPTSMAMLELVKSCIPNITKNKLFKEYAVESGKDNITWLNESNTF